MKNKITGYAEINSAAPLVAEIERAIARLIVLAPDIDKDAAREWIAAEGRVRRSGLLGAVEELIRMAEREERLPWESKDREK